MKKLGLSLAMSLVLATGALAVQAADTTTDPLPPPSFNDGRINAYDAGAPVAVFDTYVDMPVVDADGLPTTETVIDGIQLLRWNNDAENTTQVLDVSRADIEKAIAKSTKSDFTIANVNGYTLNYSQSGWFWVTTPPDAEGKVYTFTWQKNF